MCYRAFNIQHTEIIFANNMETIKQIVKMDTLEAEYIMNY